MKLTNILAAPMLASLMLAPPTAERPSPDRIIVRDADYAWIEPFGEVYAIKDGVQILDTLAWEDGTIEYLVNPTQSFTVHAFSPDDPTTPEIDRQQVDIQMDVSIENQLDWIVYNRIIWEQRMQDLIANEGLSFFDISESVARVQTMIDVSP